MKLQDLRRILLTVGTTTLLGLSTLSYSHEKEALDFYLQAHENVNLELSKVENARQCPAVNLALTCGDRKCEPSTGETEINCPSDCSTAKIRSYNSHVVCGGIHTVYTPSSIEESAEIIQKATLNGMKVRVVGSTHSVNDQLCTKGIAISTERMKKILGLETLQGKEVVNVEAGVTIGELSEWLHQRGKSLGYAIPGYTGITIAGAVATASHGNSMKKTALTSSLVEAITVIHSNGKPVQYSSDRPEHQKFLRALRSNLGSLGMVVQLKLRVQPQFNLHIKVNSESEKILFEEDGVKNWVRNCDLAQIFWYPHSKKALRICGVETNKPADPGATANLLDPSLPQDLIKPLKVALHYGSCHRTLNCLLETLRYATLQIQPPYKKLNPKGQWITTGDLVGPSHRLLTGELSKNHQMITAANWEIAIPLSKLRSVLSYVDSYFRNQNICMPMSGLAIRFVPAEDTTLLAHTVSAEGFPINEPVAVVELVTYTPAGLSNEQLNQYELPYKQFSRTLISHFNGRAHWGKNQNWIFQLQAELNTYGNNNEIFENVMKTMDPMETFKNDFVSSAFSSSSTRKLSNEF